MDQKTRSDKKQTHQGNYEKCIIRGTCLHLLTYMVRVQLALATRTPHISRDRQQSTCIKLPHGSCQYRLSECSLLQRLLGGIKIPGDLTWPTVKLYASRVSGALTFVNRPIPEMRGYHHEPTVPGRTYKQGTCCLHFLLDHFYLKITFMTISQGPLIKSKQGDQTLKMQEHKLLTDPVCRPATVRLSVQLSVSCLFHPLRDAATYHLHGEGKSTGEHCQEIGSGDRFGIYFLTIHSPLTKNASQGLVLLILTS